MCSIDSGPNSNCVWWILKLLLLWIALISHIVYCQWLCKQSVVGSIAGGLVMRHPPPARPPAHPSVRPQWSTCMALLLVLIALGWYSEYTKRWVSPSADTVWWSCINPMSVYMSVRPLIILTGCWWWPCLFNEWCLLLVHGVTHLVIVGCTAAALHVRVSASVRFMSMCCVTWGLDHAVCRCAIFIVHYTHCILSDLYIW